MTKQSKPARDVAAEITNLIVEKLEQGLPPWQRPWRGDGSGGRPLRHCGVPYTGINALYLWAIADARGYRSRYWMTYRQATELGAQVRRGEAGSISVYYSTYKRTEENPLTGDRTEKNARFLRWYVVFNADQIDGLPPHFYASAVPALPVEPSIRQDAIDRFFAAIPVEVRHGGDRAYYSPTYDFIQMPPKSSFRSMDLYASTLAHESAHWSGAASRLARTFGKKFGDQAYAAEEAVASMAQSFVCAHLDLPDELHINHASYIKHWLGILKSDKTAIIHLASKGEQAFNYLCAFSQGDEGIAAHATPANVGEPVLEAA